jgi:preprotein translocase subunit SecB
MSEKQSTFRFQDFKVLRSSIDFADITGTDFNIEINPKGVYKRKSKLYVLTLEVNANYNLNINVISILAEAQFIFDEEFNDEIPPYFTVNAPAIMFPYIRAYIAALSALSGVGTLNLPILNLVHLAEKLKANFEVNED